MPILRHTVQSIAMASMLECTDFETEEAIDEALGLCSIFIVCVSDAHMRSKTGRYQIAKALDLGLHVAQFVRLVLHLLEPGFHRLEFLRREGEKRRRRFRFSFLFFFARWLFKTRVGSWLSGPWLFTFLFVFFCLSDPRLSFAFFARVFSRVGRVRFGFFRASFVSFVRSFPLVWAFGIFPPLVQGHDGISSASSAMRYETRREGVDRKKPAVGRKNQTSSGAGTRRGGGR